MKIGPNLHNISGAVFEGIDEFFFHSEKSGRSITAAPDKIFTQNFFEDTDKG